MKQSEKLDAILKYLYERRDTRIEYSISSILEELGIATNDAEMARLANQLRTDGHIELNNLSAKLKKAKITSKGIMYSEGDSYTHKGQTVTHNNYNIVNSPQANIVAQSTKVTINQTQYDKATEIIKEMREAIGEDKTIDLTQKEEILECLAEIEAGVAAKREPKFAFKSLLSIGSNVASISKLALDLAKLFHWLPA
jgi:hypothetical protein